MFPNRFLLVSLALLAFGCDDDDDQAAGDATVDAGAPSCSEPLSLASCFMGAAFAECPGEAGEAPSLWCDDSGQDPYCLWFSTRCPADGFDRACPDGVTSADGVSVEGECIPGDVLQGWGEQPWTRARAMNVAIESGTVTSVAPTAVCSGGACETEAGCGALYVGSVCGPNRDLEVSRGWSDNGLLQLSIAPLMHSSLTLELDTANQTARACLVEATDALPHSALREPLCASAGTLTLSAIPQSAAELNALHADFSLTFPDGVTLTGGF